MQKINFLVNMYFHFFGDVSSEYIPRHGISKDKSIYRFIRFQIPVEGSTKLHNPLPTESIVRGFYFASLVDEILYLHLVLIYISLIVSSSIYLFMFQDNLFYIIVKYLVMSFPYISFGVWSFLSLF